MQRQAPRIVLILSGVAFLVSEVVLTGFLWRSWAPIVAVLAGLILFAAFGWAMRAAGLESVPEEEPRAKSRWGMIFSSTAAAALFIGMISWFPMAEIETAALSQPHHLTGQFTQPMEVKGVVRCVTPRQFLIDKISKWTFLGSWLVGVGGILIYRRLEKRELD